MLRLCVYQQHGGFGASILMHLQQLSQLLRKLLLHVAMCELLSASLYTCWVIVSACVLLRFVHSGVWPMQAACADCRVKHDMAPATTNI